MCGVRVCASPLRIFARNNPSRSPFGVSKPLIMFFCWFLSEADKLPTTPFPSNSLQWLYKHVASVLPLAPFKEGDDPCPGVQVINLDCRCSKAEFLVARPQTRQKSRVRDLVW